MQSSSTAPGNRFWIGASLILILSIVLRQLWLGEASFHPDEAIHTFFSMGFDTYKYDPVFHGPLLYHLVAATFGLMHQNDIAARMVPSLCGIGLVALIIWPFRAYAGNRGALASAALVAVSPSIVTYARRLLHDSLALFLTMGAVLCFLSALEHGASTERGRSARIGLFAFLSLFLATKANCFFIAAMLGAFWIAWLVARPLAGRLRWPRGVESWVPALLFALLIGFSIRYPVSFSNPGSGWIATQDHRIFRLVTIALCAAFGLWLLTMPQAPGREEAEVEAANTALDKENQASAPISGLEPVQHSVSPGKKNGKADSQAKLQPLEKESPQNLEAPSKTVATNAASPEDVLVSTANRTPQKRRADAWATYFLALVGALWLYFFLYGNGAQILTQWVQNRQFPTQTSHDGLANALSAIPKMLNYWGGQQKVPRLPGRHDYYLVLALLYEVPIVLAAIGGVWHAAKNRAVFTDLLLWWSFSSLAIYALANEKVPWLLVHIILPFALLGGVWLGQIRWKKPVLITLTLAGLAFSGRGVSGVNFERGADHAEPIFYAQTPDAFRGVLENVLLQTRGDKHSVWMDGERQWPSVWYLRAGGPNIDGSLTAIGGFPTPESYRAAIVQEKDWPLFAQSGWQGTTVDFLIFPRASWTALEPKRYWRWQWTRDTLPQSERDLAPSEWKTSILAGQGEWSHNPTIVGAPIR